MLQVYVSYRLLQLFYT